jgi:hypothetical protein
MVERFARWRPRMLVDADLQLNLLTSERAVA